MERKTRYVIGFACLLATLLTGCTSKADEASTASSEESTLQARFKSDFYTQEIVTGRLFKEAYKFGGAQSKDDISIHARYGEYRGAYVLSFLVGGTGKMIWNTCVGVNFDSYYLSFCTSWLPHVWKEGAILPLKDAYEEGWIIAADIPSIDPNATLVSAPSSSFS